MFGKAAYTAMISYCLFLSCQVFGAGANTGFSQDEPSIALYNSTGKRLVAKANHFNPKSSVSSLHGSNYCYAFFHPIPDEGTFETILQAAGIRKLMGVYIEENGRTYEEWVVNLLGQDIEVVRTKLQEVCPSLFFNLEPYLFEDRLTSKFLGLKEFGPGERDILTGKVFASIEFFPDIEKSRRDSIINANFDRGDMHRGNGLAFCGLRGRFQQIAAEIPEIRKISEVDTVPQPTMDVSRKTVKVDNIQVIDTSVSAPTSGWLNNTPYSTYYFGRGVNVGLYDTGVDTVNSARFPNGASRKTPNDFKEITVSPTNKTRRAIPSISWFEGGMGNGWEAHGTIDAGIIGGNGWNSKAAGAPYKFHWRGIAPKCLFLSQPMFDTGFGGHVNNHSHVLSSSGAYESGDQNVDNGIWNHSMTHTMIYAAANQGSGGSQSVQKGFYSLLVSSKNSITVGATLKDTSLIAGFSSMGPTRDGRIKPDVMAPGFSFIYPDRSVTPMTVEIDYINFKRKDGTLAKSFGFNTDGDLQGWFNHTYADAINVLGGRLQFKMAWIGAWVSDTSITGYTSNSDDTLIIRYRIKHPQIPSKMTKLRCGISWNHFLSFVDDAYFSLPTPDTTSYQYFKTALKDTRGLIQTQGVTDHSYGSQNWPTTNTAITQLYFHIESDTSTAILSANVMDPSGPRYTFDQGTSQAAPHVTGVVALMLEKWKTVVVPGANLDTKGPWNSTVKALLIHTATDMVKTKPTPQEKAPGADGILAANVDMCNPLNGACQKSGATAANSFLKYYVGPDFPTGYGQVNAQMAMQFTNKDSLLQDSVRVSGDTNRVYTMNVPSGKTSLRVTMAWDDLPGDPNRPMEESKLVNDLDITVYDPNGNIYYPWVLDPLPQNLSAGLPSDGIDPIDSASVKPAYAAPNHRDNVEVVDAKAASGSTLPSGTWRVKIGYTRLMTGTRQDYSLVSDFKLSKKKSTIGWIKNTGPCLEGTQSAIFMGDEVNANATSAMFRTTGTTGAMSPWTGGGIQAFSTPGTLIRACRESMDVLPITRNPYAVLQFSGSCPTNGISFARILNNEYGANANWAQGSIYPSTQTRPLRNFTNLWFCYVKGDNGTADPPWKSRGHGAFANVNTTVNGGCTEAHAHVEDDEDDSNKDAYDWSKLATKSDSVEIKANIFNNAETETHYFWNECP